MKKKGGVYTAIFHVLIVSHILRAQKIIYPFYRHAGEEDFLKVQTGLMRAARGRTIMAYSPY